MSVKKQFEDYTSESIPTDVLLNNFNKIEIDKEIIIDNIKNAKRNRSYFESHSIYVVNLLSSPGAGKTSILESTIKQIGKDYNIYVIECDLQTDSDFKRIKSLGVDCLQINTDCGGYLDADMILCAVKKLSVKDKSILFIENIGNLISPAIFDLGETLRVVVSSVTEGEDKPLKFPYMYESANLCLINKIDLLDYIKTNLDILRSNIMRVNSQIVTIDLSALTGENIEDWCRFLHEKIKIFFK